jgi:hypothetical protein
MSDSATPPTDAPATRTQTPWVLERKSHADLVQLAQDIVSQRVYTSNDLPEGEPSAMTSTFMCLMFLSPENLLAMQEAKVCFFYEYLSEAGPRSVNGRPVFMSFRYLCAEDYEILRPMVLSLFEARNAAVAALTPTPTPT